MSNTEIGPLDQLIMLAILRLHPKAYGISIQDEINIRAKREYSIGAIYASLDRMEAKGYIAGETGEVTQQRGGRAKRYFSLTAPGQATLKASLQPIDSLRGVRLKGAFA
jgi:PadR family transcriptional regulator, regulatory protein PadR